MAQRPMLAVLAVLGMVAVAMPAFAQENSDGKPFQLGVQQNVQGQMPSPYSSYPAPQMIQQTPRPVPVQKPPKQKPLKAKVQEDAPQRQPMNVGIQQTQQRPPMRAAVQENVPPGVLPNQFMGNWLVLGQRSKIEARPEYQNGIDGIFTASNSQTWNIVGGPGGYSMSSTSGVQQVQVGNCNSSTAFLRYAHPVGNTVAQEAIVMQLSADGQTFQGMQRITIRKQGEPSPRAMVTYQLMGRRQ